MVMHNPPHPGETIKELCIEPLGLTVTDAAKVHIPVHCQGPWRIT
jgi:plasmid maintenance system antidote protein VapI